MRRQARERAKEFELVHLPQYTQVDECVLESTKKQDGKLITKYKSKTVTTLPSGVRREQYPDGYFVIFFENGDIRQKYPNGRIVYLFKEAQVTQTELPCGERVLLFKNGQLEKHKADGAKEIYFADGGRKLISSSGEEQIFRV